MVEEPHKLSVLVPVRNQHYALRRLVERVLASPVGMDVELLIVDDGSNDWTVRKIVELSEKHPQIRAIFHPEPRGQGAAIRTAIENMTGDLAVIQEPDPAYDPAEYPELLAPILQNRADVVFGSRLASGGHRQVFSLGRVAGISFRTWIVNLLFNIRLSDTETACKAFRSEILKQTVLHSRGPAILTELSVRMAQWGVRLVEIPISYMQPVLHPAPSLGWSERLERMWTPIRTRFFRRRFTTHEGYCTLVAHERATRFNRWLFSRLRPYVGKRVLEAGSGIGTLTASLLDRPLLVGLDYDEFYVRLVALRFGLLENFRAEHFDLTDLSSYDRLVEEGFDTVICINVLEHLRNDLGVLHKFHEILVPGGNLILLVPHSMFLMSPMDVALGHFRRYEADQLASLVEKTGFDMVDLHGFNRLGGFAWLIVNRILGRSRHTPAQMRWFDRLMPLVRVCEHLLPFRHVSLICVARKPEPINTAVVEKGARAEIDLS